MSSPFDEPSYEYVERGFDWIDRWHDRPHLRRGGATYRIGPLRVTRRLFWFWQRHVYGWPW